ncbi:hypothetical protein F5883DRAFT_635069 [Diaporthe sp. PMI_573]|nr:hypothetical protein F5883DRAFT_635069 [Diaporthaceae sp. PMI_573]
MDGLEWIPDPLPPTVLDEKAFFHNLVSKTRFHVQAILSAFSTAVGLEDEQRYEVAHDKKPSNSSMTFHRYAARHSRDESNFGRDKHTDISRIAFLFAQQWGLQVSAPSQATGAAVGAESVGWVWDLITTAMKVGHAAWPELPHSSSLTPPHCTLTVACKAAKHSWTRKSS